MLKVEVPKLPPFATIWAVILFVPTAAGFQVHEATLFWV